MKENIDQPYETTQETRLKPLVINTAACDMTKMREETAASYSSITVNAAAVFVTPHVRTLMAKYAIFINAASVVDIPEGCSIAVKNGSYDITPGKVRENTALVVNGSLLIRPNSEEAVRSYVHISVNGSVLAPKSMAGELSRININGKSNYYPDEAILINGKLKLDKVFILRAKQDALYYADGKVLILEKGLDLDLLIKKNIRIKASGKVIVYESYIEAAASIFDEEAKLLFIPDGCAYVNEDTEMDDKLIRRYGPCVYVNGDLTVSCSAKAALEKIEYLEVSGDVLLCEELETLFYEKCKKFSDVKPIPKGTVISDKPLLKVDAAMLEKCEEGLVIRDCAMVRFVNDVTPDLIQMRLNLIEDCAVVSCSEAQQSAIELVAKNLAHIGQEGSEGGLGGLGAMFGINRKENGDAVVINTATYTL